MKRSTTRPSYKPSYSQCEGEERLCENGHCVSKSDLCPEQEEVNENTVLIMVIIGGAVLVFLLVLYCFQQRTRRRNRNDNAGTFENIVGDGDNASLNMPPPTYNEVISTDLYPPTPNSQRAARIPSTEEPITPPPNYDAALHILARSQENLYSSKSNTNPVLRRSVSSDIHPPSPNGESRVPDVDFRRILSTPEERP